MKKAAALCSAVMMLGLAMSASAVPHKIPPRQYPQEIVIPYYYTVANESEDFIILKNGAVYINRSNGDGEDIPLSMDTYIRDEGKYATNYVLALESYSDEVQMVKAINPVEKYGHNPFKDLDDPDVNLSIVKLKDVNATHVYYMLVHPSYKPAELIGENTDDYPILCSEAVVSKDASAGSYRINASNLVYPINPSVNKYSFIGFQRTNDPLKKEGDYAVTYYSDALYVHISDRELGDIDGDGKITTEDAETVMSIYSNDQNGYEPDLEDTNVISRRIACDVNGDEKIDDEDAELILDYCSEQGKDPEMTLNEFICSR